MAMDSYYTDRFDKYANDQGIYHVLFSCPRGMVIKEKHRILGVPPLSEHRRPCELCIGEIKDWLTSLPAAIRPSQFQGEGPGDNPGEGPGEVPGEVDDADRAEVDEVNAVDEVKDDQHEYRAQEENEVQEEGREEGRDQGEIVLPE